MSIHELLIGINVKDANAAIEFYKKVFGVKERFRLNDPSGKVGHAELEFGAMTLFVADEFPDFNLKAPVPGAPASMTLHLHVDNCDDIVKRAVEAGATLQIPPTDQFYGERSGTFIDPFGFRWNIGHQIEKLSPEEMQRRYDEMGEP